MSDTNDDIANGNGRPPTPHETAATAYAARLRNVGKMLDWLGEELEAHAAKQRADARNWGFVGDLVEVEASVRRALGHLSGMGEARIDEALAESDA